jgi:HD-like signal output (HDOD) protein
MNIIVVAALVIASVILAVVIHRVGKLQKSVKTPAPVEPGKTRSRGYAVVHPTELKYVDTDPRPVESVVPAEECPQELRDLRLIEADELPQERRDALDNSLQAIKMPSPTLRQLASPEFLENGSARELSELIMREPAVATKVLAIVNSPLYGLESPIVSLLHAINFLGLNAIRSIVMQTLMESTFSANDPETRKMHAVLWDAASVASELVARLAQRLDIGNRGALATQTLFAFVGHFATLNLLRSASALPLLRSEPIARTRAEQEQIGLNSAYLGVLLMKRWQLPQPLLDGVRDMAGILLTPPAAVSPASRGVPLALCYACVRIAERAAFEGLREIGELDLLAEQRPDTFHLRAWLARPELAKFHEHLHATELVRDIRRMILAIGKR